ncbi:SDR family oxidoreductase [Kitasatospora sp. NPDC005748]|uniref:SDR family oxidoreductase n=1 Tax=Kitasatospora sp. NPDC005748 TaxID=3157063 RepID=UPI0033C33342
MNSTTPPQHRLPQPLPRTLVLGATGFLGRWLVLELLDRGEPVAAGIRGGRGSARDGQLRHWLREHGADDTALTTVAADLTRPGLGLGTTDEARLTDIRDIHNLAALYRFGLERTEADAANVDGALHVLHWAATRPGLRRLVHLSGYRVGRDATPRYPLPAAETDALYTRLGAYEASKLVGDAAVRVTAARLGVPLTTVNPSSVVGHSVTGEAGQYLGLAELVRQLAHRRLPLLPGSARTFLPVVAVDHLARFLAAVPEFDDGPVHSHTVLDPATPPLPELIGLLADHLGVPAPRALVPVGLVRRLPRALTGADPETLSFLSEDGYDTTSADRLARAAGLHHPPVADVLRRWATRLVADGFGTTATGTDPLTPGPHAPGRRAPGRPNPDRAPSRTGRFAGFGRFARFAGFGDRRR